MNKYDPKHWGNAYKWQFEAYPFFTSVFTGLALPAKNKYFSQWDDVVHCFRSGNNEEYKGRQSIAEAGQIIVREALEGDETFFRLFKQLHHELKLTTDLCLKIRSDGNFVDYDLWWPSVQKALSGNISILFNFDFIFDEHLQNLKETDYEKFIAVNVCITEDEPSFVNKADEYLVDLLSRYPGNFNLILKMFTEKFGWFQNSYKGIFEITADWLAEYASHLNTDTSSNKFSVSKLPPKEYELVIKIAKEAIIFRDNKKKLLLVAVELMQKWLTQICEEKGYDYEAMRWLTFDEILMVLNGEGNELLDRAEGYHKKNCRFGLMIPAGYDDLSEEFWNEIINIQKRDLGDEAVKGLPASKGIVTGRARIILDPRLSSNDFREGDVLITSMTRPEFVPLLRLASAIVTDEGGIACHAAIVARELKKPCIIGTRVATKAFKDGDLIEVDANNGTVRILKS